MSTRPLIGITCDLEDHTTSRGTPARRHQLNVTYVEAILAAGAVAVLLPTQPADRAAACLAPLAGLVVSGGDMDVPPAFYAEGARPGLRRLCPERSSFERALLAHAWAEGLPTLGVCGGMQLMNVFAGGTLHQDLSERTGSLRHEQPQDIARPHHAVTLVAPSRLAAIFAPQPGAALSIEVNSTHHQAVATVGDGLRAVAHAPDGLVEAIEASDRPFWLGVQWHPESLMPPERPWAIYRALVSAAGRAS